MKRSCGSLLAMVVVACCGCDQAVPGGPGVTTPTQKPPVYGETDNTFNLRVPRMSASVTQGGSKEVSIDIERGKNFSEDVTLKFAEGPKGITLTAPNPVILHGETQAKVTLKATDDASLGDFTVKVTGHPAKGADASNELKFTVIKK